MAQAKQRVDCLIYFLVSFFVVLSLILISLNLNVYLANNQVLGISTQEENDQTEKEIVFWKNFLTQNPTYLDGLVELSKLYLKVGQVKEAVDQLKQALLIDPNNEVVNSLLRSSAQ